MEPKHDCPVAGPRQPDGEPQPVPVPDNVLAPTLDIYESDQGLVIEADLPGVPDNQLEVSVRDNVLHIHGKVAWPLPDGARLVPEYSEIRTGDFYRSFILGDEVDTDHITADFSLGVLRLTLPRAI